MVNLTEINKAVEDGLVYKTKHPTEELCIYNYSPRVQYERLWTETIKQCRGLILDGEGNVVARPFPKFFNIEEHDEIPNLPFDVYEKLDGSLGILYWIGDTPYIATRGSFISEQAIHATEKLREYSHIKLDRNKTYLFEIIFPSNRIVVDYLGMDEIVLLTVIDNETGEESLPKIGFSRAFKYDGINDIAELRGREDMKDREGFVIRFSNGLRMKLKFAEYLRLHRIITQCSNLRIWEIFRDGKPLDEMLDRVPDEFYDWVKRIFSDLNTEYNVIEHDAKEAVKKCWSPDRKTFAFRVINHYNDLKGVMFKMYEQKEYRDIIMKMIRPKFSKPFKIENSNYA